MSIVQPDVTLFLDLRGVIQKVTLANEVSDEQVDLWPGRSWIDTVAEAGGEKVRRILDEVRSAGLSAFRQVNQRFPSGRELPIEYTTIRLGGRAGLLAIGRNLQAVAELQSRLIAAQQAMERDYWKLREVETRYRLLFDTANEAVLLVRASDLKIVEANPMAIRALGLAPNGRDLLEEVGSGERESLQAMLLRVREQGRSPGILVHLGPEQRPWLVRAAPVVSEPGFVFLVQLSPVGAPLPDAEIEAPLSLDQLLDRLPDALVLLDREGTVQRANRTFLDLVQIPAEHCVRGKTLGRWLNRPGADLAVFLEALGAYGLVRRFLTAIRGELGSEAEVEISAVAEQDRRSEGRILAVLRDVSRRPAIEAGTRNLDSDHVPLVQEIGRTPLPQIVREAVEQVERHHIVASLERTGGNRTAAAALLGLSRQSLYAKLERYGLDGSAADDSSDRSE